MSRTKKEITDENENTPIYTENIDEIVKEKDKEKEMQSKIDKLEGMLQAFMSMNSNNNNSPTIIDTTSKMDKPCTLIHLIETDPNLPTTIFVNGVTHYFTKIGEERTYRFSDMQNICSKDRSYFERGIFTLGEDCLDKKEELGLNILSNYIPIGIYNKIEQLSDEEFESLVKKINNIQRANLARTWAQRYVANKTGYSDISKIRILNKYTKDKTIFKNGILKNLLDEIISTENNIDDSEE